MDLAEHPTKAREEAKSARLVAMEARRRMNAATPPQQTSQTAAVAGGHRAQSDRCRCLRYGSIAGRGTVPGLEAEALGTSSGIDRPVSRYTSRARSRL